MKMRSRERVDIGNQKRKPWVVLGLLLLSLVSTGAAVAQKPPDVLPSTQSTAAVGLSAASAQAAAPGATARLTALTTSRDSGDLVVSVTTSAPVEHREYLYDGPSRLVLDLWYVESRVPFQKLDIDSGSVKKVRVGEFMKGERKTTRLVFDLEPGAEKYKIQTNGPVIRLVFPANPGSPELKAAPKAEAPKPVVPKTSAPKPSATKPEPSTASVPNQGVPPSPSVPKATATVSPVSEPVTAPKQSAPKVKATTASVPDHSAFTAASVPKATAAISPVSEPVTVPKQSAPKVKTATASVPDHSAPAAVPVPKATAAVVAPAPEPVVVPKPPSASKASAVKNTSAPVQQATDVPPVVKPPSAKQTLPPVLPEAAALTAHDHLSVAEIPKPAAPPATQVTEVAAYRPVPIKVSPPEPQPARAVAPPPSTTPAVPAPVSQESRFTGTPLTLDLVDISLVDFFRLMAEEGGINVVLDPEIRGTLSMKVVKVPWDQIFEAALLNNGLDKQVEGNLVRIARKATLQEEAKQRESLKKANLLAADLETKIKRLNYAKAISLIPTLAEQKSVRGTVVFDERTNSLILTDLPSSISRMLELVESLDIPQPQVEIEARIVSATRDFARDIGVQFGFVQGNLERVTVGGPNTFGTIGGTRPAATPTTTYAAGNPRTGRGASEGTSTQSAGISTGTGTGEQAGNFNVNLAAQKAFGGIGISVGNIFDTFLLDAAITAGESKGLAKLISQPKTVTTNNSPATITQGLRFPVQIIANNTITVQFQNAALTLVATPQITYEGNVVLDLSIENNTPDFSRAVNGIPSIRTSESKTRVLVTDGGTTVIGGILIDQEETSQDRVPGLASLPLIGHIFRRDSVSHSTQEVLFFITPKIIK